MDTRTTAFAPVSIVGTCPVCRGTARNPEAPACIADDELTCLLCCVPGPLYVRPGVVELAPVLLASELEGLRGTGERFGLTMVQVCRARDGAWRTCPTRCAAIFRVSARKAGPWGTLSDRVADVVMGPRGAVH